MKHLRTPALIAGLMITSFSFADPMPAPASLVNEPVNWMSWEEATAQPNEEKRKYIVDLYTDWCGWCKKMDATTFKDETVMAYLRENFYPVKFDAEQKEDLVFNGHTFKFQPYGRRGAHELAIQLLNGRMSYPSIVYLNEEFEIITVSPGFKQPGDIMKELHFVGKEIYKDKTWAEYQQSAGK